MLRPEIGERSGSALLFGSFGDRLLSLRPARGTDEAQGHGPTRVEDHIDGPLLLTLGGTDRPADQEHRERENDREEVGPERFRGRLAGDGGPYTGSREVEGTR